MSILNFVSQAQLDELDEDPKIAFKDLVNIAQRSLYEQTVHLDDDDQKQWREIEDKRLSFINSVLASAKRLEIQPFLAMDVPKRNKFDNRDYEQFKDDLEHYITQLVLDNSIRSRSDSVDILPKSKDTIRRYIFSLRECIENSNISKNKREALLTRLVD